MTGIAHVSPWLADELKGAPDNPAPLLISKCPNWHKKWHNRTNNCHEIGNSSTYISLPPSLNSLAFSCIPACAASRMSAEIFIEQNFGPHMEQKCATLAPSAGSVSSW